MEKKRVLIQKATWQQGQYDLLTGSNNLNTVVYTGSLAHCIFLRNAYMATGEYENQTSPEWEHKEAQKNTLELKL